MFDCHVHGYRSFDSNEKYENLLNAALEKNLSGITLTEHLDLIPDKIKEVDFDFNSYINEIKSINETSPGKILTGIELGLVDFSINELNKFIDSNPFDCVIGSVHFINNEDPYYPDYFEKRDKQVAYALSFEKYIHLLPLYPNVNVMGHFDYIARYTEKYEDRNIYYKDFSDYFDTIFEYIIKNNISMEINTSSYRQRNLKCNTLDTIILKRYRELGGELITLGSDAHNAVDVGYNFSYFTEIIANCGFKYITHFEKRKPVPVKII